MPRYSKNPNWKEDLQFALDRGCKFRTACAYAEISAVWARQLGYKSKRIPASKKSNEILSKFNKGHRIKDLAKEYKCSEGHIFNLINY